MSTKQETQPVTLTSEVAYKNNLSLQQLKATVPSVFTESSSPNTTESYNHMPTDIIVKDLVKEGWVCNRAFEVRCKKESNKGFQKHFLYFRHPSLWIGRSKDEIELLPELLLCNSHDGKAAFNFYSNLFRVVCSNSAVVSTHSFGHVSVKHRSYTLRELREITKAMIDNTQSVVMKIEAMQNRLLTPKEARSLALECCRARWDHHYKADYKNLLVRNRIEDEENNLWTIYQVLQEKLIRGGWIGAGNRTIKKIVDHNREININRKLFTIVDNFLN